MDEKRQEEKRAGARALRRQADRIRSTGGHRPRVACDRSENEPAGTARAHSIEEFVEEACAHGTFSAESAAHHQEARE
jgi:hypothetical protein